MILIKKRLESTRYAVLYYKKAIIMIALLMIIGSCMLAFCTDSWRNAEGMTANVMEQLDKICNIESLDSVRKKVSITFDDDASSLKIGGRIIENIGILTSVSDIFTGIAFCIITLTFFLSFMSVREQEMAAEELVKKMALFAASIVVVFFARTLCLGVANIGTGIAEKVASVVSNPEDMEKELALVNNIKQAIYEQCHVENEGHWYSSMLETLDALGIYLQLMIPSIAMYTVSLITNVVCWSRAFEILILSTFAPLAFADATDIDHQFGRGGGARFIKNVMALSISGAIIIFVMALSSNISINILADAMGVVEGASYSITNFLARTGDLLIVGFAQAGLVLKAQSMGKTICGVG